jgi:hypothetical protein
VKRVLDIVLIVVILCAAGFGAYEIGRRVDHLSNQAASQDSELNQTTATVRTVQHHSNKTPYFIVGGVAVGVAAIALGSAVEGMRKGRRRQRWHAT